MTMPQPNVKVGISRLTERSQITAGSGNARTYPAVSGKFIHFAKCELR